MPRCHLAFIVAWTLLFVRQEEIKHLSGARRKVARQELEKTLLLEAAAAGTNDARQLSVSLVMPMAGKKLMSETSIKNHVGYIGLTLPKTVDKRRHDKVGLRVRLTIFSNPIHLWLWKIVACSQSVPFVSTLFGMVSSLHPTDFCII